MINLDGILALTLALGFFVGFSLGIYAGYLFFNPMKQKHANDWHEYWMKAWQVR